MSKEDFLYRLHKGLDKLPKQEIDNALAYYTEYLEEVEPENLQAAMDVLGSPEKIASQINADFAVKNMQVAPTAKKGLSTVWIVLLAVFASPIAVPIALAVAAVALSLVIVLISLIVSVAAVAISLTVAGVLTMIVGLCLIFQNFPTALFYFGGGLFSFGVGLAFIPLVIWLSKKGFNLIAKSMSRLLPGRKKNEDTI